MASGDLSTFFVCSLLLLLCIVQASGAGLVLPICHESMIKGEFYIPKTLQCVRHNTTSIINCSADVYYPSDNFIKILITTCELYKTTSETTTYFFGAKTNDNHTYHLPPPSVAVCSEWARTLKSNCCGRLAQISDISWATSNAPAMVYVWPTTHRETVKNAVVSRITGIYVHLRKQLTSPLNSLSHCAIKKGSCITGNRVHIWEVPRMLDCPRVTKIKKIHNVKLHLNSLKQVYRAEIKQLGISLHSQTTCPPSVFTCFPKSSVCDPSGIILVPHHCFSLKSLQVTKRPVSKPPTLPFVRFLQEMTDTMQETINKLNSDLNFQECQLQSLFTTLYSLVGRQYPGQVLTSLLRKPTAGITVGDVLTEITCINSNVTLLPSMRHGNVFSSRPLVRILGPNSTSQIGQVYRDGNVYVGVRLIENFVPSRIFTFLIHDKFYTFSNYTLIHSDANVYPLSPNLAPINAHYDTIDFQSFTHLFPSSTLGFEDVNSLLQTISETNMMRDQLSSLFQHTDTSTNTYKPSYTLDATTSSIQNVFMQLISSISNPFINFLVTTAFVLSLIWSIILTTWTLRMCVSLLINKVKNRTHPLNGARC